MSYVAEYKEARQTWEEARKRYWFQEAGGTFELGNLEPWTSYNIRSATIDIKYVQLSFFVTCTQLINFNSMRFMIVIESKSIRIIPYKVL